MITAQVIFITVVALLSGVVNASGKRTLMLRNHGSDITNTNRRKLENKHLTCVDTDDIDLTMSLYGSNLLHNNLGGQGPNYGDDEVIHYENIGHYNDKTLDLIVSLEDGYTYRTHKNTRNGYRCKEDVDANCETGYFAKLTQQKGRGILMKMSIVDSETKEPVKVPTLKFSVFDIDESENGNTDESFAVTGYEYAMYQDGDNAEASFEEGQLAKKYGYDFCNAAIEDGSKCIVAKSTMSGHGNGKCDNPWDPNQLGVVTCGNKKYDQLKRSFQVDFLDVDSFNFYFAVGGNGNGGRGVQFTLGTTSWDDVCTDKVLPESRSIDLDLEECEV